MSQRPDRQRQADRGILLVVAGFVIVTHVAVRALTDLGPWPRIGISLLVGVVVAGAVMALLVRRRT